ncbi:MAG: aspartyl-phosphate phosphatase Spo0E family protein [Firmicutes bacterium]|nr:aspartyl-phosphate phosphatase Spo0E family protein [Bacillota bacterium]
MDKKLWAQIEHLRRRLNGVDRKDQDKLLALSQHLDRLIVQYQRQVLGEFRGEMICQRDGDASSRKTEGNPW